MEGNEKKKVSSMGNLILKLLGRRDLRLLMVGLDNAGKSTILERLKLGEPKTTIPTVGFQVETVVYKKCRLTIWDVGGQARLRPLWRHYFTGVQGLLFVVDSSDPERMDEAKRELHKILLDGEMANVTLLVLANKQDEESALGPLEVQEALGLWRAPVRRWQVQPSCALTSEGLYEGLHWLTSNI